MARRSRHSAQKRRRELARAERHEKKRERRATHQDPDADTLINEYRGVDLPTDIVTEEEEDDEEDEDSEQPQ
jgi:hypothetical protein